MVEDCLSYNLVLKAAGRFRTPIFMPMELQGIYNCAGSIAKRALYAGSITKGQVVNIHT